MVSSTWEYARMPLNLQWPVVENNGADFHHSYIAGLLILCSRNVLDL